MTNTMKKMYYTDQPSLYKHAASTCYVNDERTGYKYFAQRFHAWSHSKIHVCYIGGCTSWSVDDEHTRNKFL